MKSSSDCIVSRILFSFRAIFNCIQFKYSFFGRTRNGTGRPAADHLQHPVTGRSGALTQIGSKALKLEYVVSPTGGRRLPFIELGRPPPQLRPGLNVALVLERCLPRPQCSI